MEYVGAQLQNGNLVQAHGPADPPAPSGSEPLDTLVAEALRAPRIDAFLYSNQGYFPRFMEILDRTLKAAFDGRDQGALRAAHRSLFYLYEQNFEELHENCARNQFHPFIIRVRNEIESAWEKFETGRIDVSFDEIPADGEAFTRFFRDHCARHRLAGHPLFDFIEHEATRGQIARFFACDSALILRFCDLITLSMIGADDEVLGILAENFWDEMGNGDLSRRHTILFKRLLAYVGVEKVAARDWLAAEGSWQALAGYNLYLYLSLHRRNHLMSLGCLGCGEMMDVGQYVKILRGCERVGLTDRQSLAYYVGHAEVDIRHGDEWLDKVLTPLAGKHAQARRHIITGASLRLNNTADYYDFLLSDLGGGGAVP